MAGRCACRSAVPADWGNHRDPISSEKCWLDYAVRELSRVAAGKGRGQEAVWRAQCKPVWWDNVCTLPWKNPTANPKDSKDTLNTKFECLLQHLEGEGKVPREMREEIGLWEAGKQQEVFRLTTYSSMLGRASDLHGQLMDTCGKMDASSASAVEQRYLSQLRRCLMACVQTIDAALPSAPQDPAEQAGDIGGSTCLSPASSCGRKRPFQDSDITEHSLSSQSHKCLRRSPANLSSSSPSMSASVSSVSSSVFASSPSDASALSSLPFSSSPAPVCLQPVIVSEPTPASLSVSPLSASPKLSVSPPLCNTVCNVALTPDLLNLLLQGQLQGKEAAAGEGVTVLPSQSPKVCLASAKRQKKTGRRKVAAAAVSAPASSGVSHLPAAVPLQKVDPPTSEVISSLPELDYPDFLDIDFDKYGIDLDDCGDSNFHDKLLEGLDLDEAPTVECSESNRRGRAVENPLSNLADRGTDPTLSEIIGLTTSNKAEIPSEYPGEMVAGRSSSDKADSLLCDIGTSLCPDVGTDIVVMETEVCESGYSSEASTSVSLRNSLDQITSPESIGWPDSDLEAYMNTC